MYIITSKLCTYNDSSTANTNVVEVLSTYIMYIVFEMIGCFVDAIFSALNSSVNSHTIQKIPAAFRASKKTRAMSASV